MQTRMKRIIYVAHDHLNLDRGALKTANPSDDLVVLVESERMTSDPRWHKERLFFLLSSARHFARELEQLGFTVRYERAATTVDGLTKVRQEFGDLPIVCAEPSSHRQTKILREFGVEFVANDFFLTPRPLFAQWASGQKSFVMENFYRSQRTRLNVLMSNGKPIGDRWNFDAENRLPPPKNAQWPTPPEHERDELDLEVCAQLQHQPTKTWATTRAGALSQLDHFVSTGLAAFGPYEDAVTQQSWSLNHSLLSPYLNNGLLTADEIIAVAIDKFNAGGTPLESIEAFVRQIIGWREYINGMYWFLGEDYRDRNELGATRKLLPLFTDSTKTKMTCVGTVVSQVEARAWTHHIPRLMILSNLALVTGTNPQEFLDWMRQNFVDASEWVMVPNIIGMATNADGGLLMTKPYAAGGAYLNRMTDFCKSCAYDPKLRVGETACPFTTLYWDFLDRHREQFSKNHRMFQQFAGLAKLKDREELRERAQQVLNGLDAGQI